MRITALSTLVKHCLKKAAQLEKNSFSFINPVIHLMTDIQTHRHTYMCTQFSVFVPFNHCFSS